ADRAAQRLDAPAMTLDARQSARRGPAPVAVHDDGDVTRRIERRRGIRLVRFGALRTFGLGHSRLRSSNGEDFLFLARKHVVDFGDRGIRRFLDVGGKAVVVVLADLVILLLLLDHVEAVAADVTNGDARRLAVFVGDLDEFLAALLVQFGNAQAQRLPFGRRRQAEIGIHDRLFDRVHERAIPDIDGDQPRLGNGDARYLIKRHLRAIGVDHHRVEHVGGSAPGAQAGQFGLEYADGARHPALEFVDIVGCICHGVFPPAWCRYVNERELTYNSRPALAAQHGRDRTRLADR